MDFMTNRRFVVSANNAISSEKSFNIGCVQGSVLGPKLFAIYCNELEKVLEGAHVVSYADDAYISLSDSCESNLKIKLEETLSKHQEYMRNIGMIINEEKTELIYYSKNKEAPKLNINGIESRRNIKALGVKISHDLSFDSHALEAIAKASRTTHLVSHLGRWFKTDDLMKIVTSKFFGQLYYASPVWMTNGLKSTTWKALNRAHYKALRAAFKDRSCEMHKDDLNRLSKRATPLQWAKYSTTSCAIKLLRKAETPLAIQMKNKMYVNDRKPHRGKFINTTLTKIGREALPYRLNTLSELTFDWLDENLSDNEIRVNLKRHIGFGL